MAYGDNRQLIATDTFDTELNLTNWSAYPAFTAFTWQDLGDGEIDGDSTNNCIRWDGNSFSGYDDQWASVKIGTVVGTNTAHGVALRLQAGDNEAHYRVYNAMNSNYWAIWEYFDGGSYSLLSSNGGGHTDLVSGDTVFGEVEGTTIRVGDDSVSQGTDVQRDTTTDATLTSGQPGIGQYLGGGNTHTTEFQCGYIGSVPTAAIPTHYRRHIGFSYG